MYSFGQSVLYNVYDKVIVSSVPIRHMFTNLISYEEEKNYSNIKAELMKRAFYNNITPQRFIGQSSRQIMSAHIPAQRTYDINLSLLVTDTIESGFAIGAAISHPRVLGRSWLACSGETPARRPVRPRRRSPTRRQSPF